MSFSLLLLVLFYKFELCQDFIHLFGEGSGTLLQYSCLENPMDGGAGSPWGHKELDTTE